MKAEFRDVIGAAPTKNPPGKEGSAFGEAVIKLVKDHKPFRQSNFALTDNRLEALGAIISQFLERGWIAHLGSVWGSPAFIVPKKTKRSWRLVVDYRRLNFMTEMDSYAIPLINDILQDQVQKCVFSVLDLKHGYHHMKLAKQSQDCTAMCTPFGTYKWLVMPMGVKNGNAAFQHLLNDVLKDYRDFARPFVDDIIVSVGRATYEEAVQNHVKLLRLVLQRLRKNKLTVSADKAMIFVKQVEFTGHVLGDGVKRRIPGKIVCREKWDKPRTVSELRAFVGFAQNYQEFVCIYAHHAAPPYSMPQLLKSEARKGYNHPSHWTPERDTALEDLKRELLKPFALFLDNPYKPFVIQTNASDYAMGAVLEQTEEKGNHYPVAFWSRVLSPSQRKSWTPRTKEAYAIVSAVR